MYEIHTCFNNINYTDIVDLNGTLRTMVNGLTTDYGKYIERSITYFVATTFGNDLCDLMRHERMQKFIKNPPNDPPYDLIIVEYFGSPCYIGFGQLLNAPVAIIISSKKVKKGPQAGQFVTKVVTNDSFFNYFDPTEKVLDDDVENEEALHTDFEIGQIIRDQIIPRAVLFYTGEAADDDDDFFEDDEDEDADAVDDSDDDA